MYQLTDADVLKLKCLYFELVRNYVEQHQYGIICDSEETLDKIKRLKAALFINEYCTTNYKAHCKVKNILNSIYDFCKKTITACENREYTCVDCV